MKALPQGFTIVKLGIAFHSPMKRDIPTSSTASRTAACSTAPSTPAS